MRIAESRLPDWNRAHGSPLFRGQIKQQADDFRVDEQLGFELSGDGEHDWLRVEKTNANSAWVARQLARHAGVALKDVGYSGRKDRRAVTTQWFSIHRAGGTETDWDALAIPGISIIERRRNNRKLRRGVHRSNVFQLLIRNANVDAGRLEERMGIISASGVPNYFGPQRFGRHGANLALADSLFAGRRLSRDQRSMAISAARSFLFNEVLSARVKVKTWNRIVQGDVVNLAGTNSVFHPDAIDEILLTRLMSSDIHPTGPLFGAHEHLSTSGVAKLETEIKQRNKALADGLAQQGVTTGRRALRTQVDNLQWELSGDILEFAFSLGRGSYATSVLREFACQ